MNVTWKRAITVTSAAMMCLVLGVQAGRGQAEPDQKSQKAEDVFKNVQVLRGISVKEFMGTMGFFSAALSLNCSDCHVQESNGILEKYADDTPLKQTARKMVLMVNALNKNNFGSKRLVTCYTCHRGNQRPEITPSLDVQYGTPVDDPDLVETIDPYPNQPTADRILDKYVRALGGAQQLSTIKSIVAKGTYKGYDTANEKVAIEIYAKAPDQASTIVHGENADSVTTYDGSHGWSATADKLMQVLPLTGGDLDGVKMDAALAFPERLAKRFEWQSNFPMESIKGRPVQVIQAKGMGAAGGVKLYFDNLTGLLVRQTRYSDTAVGLIPTRIDYSDYRLVGGIKVPFHRVVTWTDGRSTIDLTVVQPNVAIADTKFAEPPPPRAKAKSAAAR